MTCVVGIVSDKIYLAADSLGSTSYSKQEYKTAKLVCLPCVRQLSHRRTKNVSIGIGFTSSFRMGDLLKHRFTPPTISLELDTEAYLVSLFIPKLIDCFDDNYYSRTKEGSKTGGVFLVGLEHRLFVVQEDFSVLEPVCNYAAIGSGSEVATGALYASTHLPSAESARLAITAASTFVPSVGGNVSMLEI